MYNKAGIAGTIHTRINDGDIGGSHRLLKQSNVLPLNDMPDGTCRTLKANYFKTGRINFQYHNDWGTTGAKVIYETE